MEANPQPEITWQKNSEAVTFDQRISSLKNGSIQISTCELADSGTWTIIADNGLGRKARKQITLDCHPSRVAVEVYFSGF